jgi:acyl carrier protein
MSTGSSTPHATAQRCFLIDDVCALVAKQFGVDIELVSIETHLTNDLGADFLDRVELMLAIEDHFAGVEITADDVEQIKVVGDLIRRLENKTNSQRNRKKRNPVQRLRIERVGDVRGAISEH